MLKKIIRKIDDVLLAKTIQKQHVKYMIAKTQSQMRSSFDYKIVIYYQKNLDCELSKLCDVYGTDKGWIRKEDHPVGAGQFHNYTDFYSQLFRHCRNSVKNVFECGIGTNNPNIPSSMGVLGKPGASLRVWRDYFPNAMVYGADIDRDILFEEDRIKTFFIDQLDPTAIKSFWNKVGVNDFDFMIDDGLHTFEAGSTLFLNSIDKLAANGIYVIEDVTIHNLLRYKDFFRNKNYVVEYVSLFGPSVNFDDNIVVIRKKNEM